MEHQSKAALFNMNHDKIKSLVISIIISVIVALIVQWIMKKLTNLGKIAPVVPGQKVRGCDQYGCGYFGASRSGHTHQGIDIVVQEGAVINSPISGTVSRFPKPYSNDSRYNGIEIVGEQYKVKIFYCNSFVPVGTQVKAGQKIASAQNIAAKYGDGMTNHVHVEFRTLSGQLVDPSKIF